MTATAMFIDGPLKGALRAIPEAMSTLRAYQQKPGTGESQDPFDIPDFTAVDYRFQRVPFLGHDILIGWCGSAEPIPAEGVAAVLLSADAFYAWSVR